jgi:predicted nucleotidyltransferase component of viral defense system
MIDERNFKELVDLAMQQPGREVMRPVVEKELLHYDIFHALDNAGLLKDLVFQGGTSLRLCRGSNRFSEDLDFAGGRDFNAGQLAALKSCVERYLGARYGSRLKVEVKEPKETAYEAVKVDKWQVSVETAPEQRNLPRQRIKIEVANVPAYTRELVPLKKNYDFLQGYDALLVNAESLDEVMADKILAYPVSKAIRYRDIWDLAWMTQQGATLRADLVLAKIVDYQVVDYPARLEAAIAGLPDVVKSKAFHDQMSRFIDGQMLAKTLDRPEFLDYLVKTTTALFIQMQEQLVQEERPQDDEDTPDFKM